MLAFKSQQIVCLSEQIMEAGFKDGRQSFVASPLHQRLEEGTPAYVAAAVTKLGGASRLMCLEHTETDRAWLDDVAVCHFCSVPMAKDPFRVNAAYEAASRIKQAGGLISYCPNMKPELWANEEAMREDMLQHVRLADIVKVREEEASFLTGLEPEEAVQQLLGMGAKAVVVTLGKAGCYVVTRFAMTFVPGIRVKVVDPMGAGDSFVGAMLVKLVEQGATSKQIEAILTDEEQARTIFAFANKVGAMTTTRLGVLHALPTIDEIEEL
jgi:fructokinase